MRVLVISEAGYSADLFTRAQSQGHDIRLWIMQDGWKHVHDGLIDKVERWEPSLDWAELVVFDHSGMSSIGDKIKGKKPMFGGEEFADKLEKDRPFSKKLFKDLGLPSQESLKTNTYEEAISHLQTHKIRHVVKPVGKEMDSHNVIIGEDSTGRDAVALLEVFREQGLTPDYIEIEEFKEGIEVGVSGWFISSGNGPRSEGRWSGPININFEHKKLATGLPEGLGPLTGELGTAMRYCSQDNPLFLRTLDKLRPILARNGYRGQIDMSMIVDKNGIAWPIELTPRLGYPACMIEESLQKSQYVDLFWNTAIGNTSFDNEVKDKWAIGVVCIMPGFPSTSEVEKRSLGIPVFGLWEENKDSTHLVEVEKKKGRIVTSPGMGYPMVITGLGDTIMEAKSNAYRTIANANPKRVRIPNMIYRTDIGDRVMRQEKDFESLGIIEASNNDLSLLIN